MARSTVRHDCYEDWVLSRLAGDKNRRMTTAQLTRLPEYLEAKIVQPEPYFLEQRLRELVRIGRLRRALASNTWELVTQ